MQKPDVLRVTFDQNPSMVEALADVKPGDKGKCEVHYTLKDKDAEGANFIIEAVVPEGYEIADDDEEEHQTPTPTSDAMMTPSSMLVRKLKKS